ncbi:hypothetical protein ACH5RR_004310 [Cinchona calisaya]|uniref:Uncharacterized protein n=1 Tax=Cinchona calisaya TaxID=153742 RepID=A0ABD3AY06_9GENT
MYCAEIQMLSSKCTVHQDDAHTCVSRACSFVCACTSLWPTLFQCLRYLLAALKLCILLWMNCDIDFCSLLLGAKTIFYSQRERQVVWTDCFGSIVYHVLYPILPYCVPHYSICISLVIIA